MTGFFKGIQKSRQTLLGRRAFEALIEEFRQQDSVSLEKLNCPLRALQAGAMGGLERSPEIVEWRAAL